MAEGTVIAENTVGELMQDSVSRTLAIEMLDGVWKPCKVVSVFPEPWREKSRKHWNP
mgnify:CR=1 FL=1